MQAVSIRTIALSGLVWIASLSTASGAERPPNVLFIAIDDLNDWVGCLGGHEQVETPHIDRLARRGVSFTNAHCQAPICVPSRTSMLTGSYPWRNGVYMIEQKPREAPALKDAVTLPQYFKQHGYHTMGVGKIYHRAEGDADAWDEWGGRHGWSWMVKRVGPEGVSGLPNPQIFDFGPIPAEDAEMSDMKHVAWGVERLGERHDKPFFLAVGLITPHLPLFTPPEYYNRYPLDRVELPPTLPGDLDDLPPLGRKFTRYFDTTPMSHLSITRHGLWHKAVASYLACATFTDACVGRLLDALSASPYSENTVIVVWSDHGFHLGEKMHWEKRSLWEESTRVPLVFVTTEKNRTTGHCTRPVGLIDIYPTLVELCGLPDKEDLQGRSLVPLLKDPAARWEFPAITTHHPGNHAIRTERWRYIQYANGDRELYDHESDPHEWHNLAEDPRYADVIGQLRKHVPRRNAPYAPKLPRNTYTQEFDWSKP